MVRATALAEGEGTGPSTGPSLGNLATALPGSLGGALGRNYQIPGMYWAGLGQADPVHKYMACSRLFFFSNQVSRAWLRKFIKHRFFQFFDFLDPASVFEVSDMALLIPEVWDFYRLSGASFFFVII